MTEHRRDDLFARPQDLVDFQFDSQVVDVFPDMIRRSVAGYETALSLGGWLAARQVKPGTRIYDLGCSLLAGSLALTHQIPHRDYTLVAVDNSAAMIERATELLGTLPDPPPITLQCSDIEELAIANASAVLMHFTLQFIAPAQRDALLNRIRRGMVENGALVVSEKTQDDSAQALWLRDAHLDFKRANGYSELEIEQKRASLDNVMRPDSEGELCERMTRAGFTTVLPWFRCLNWVSVVAIP